MNKKGYELIKLPIYKNEPQNIRELISRNVNHKGEFTRLTTDEINYLAYVDFRLGKEIRANHYHKNKEEYLYLCKGVIKGYFKYKSEIDIVEERIIEEGTLVHILPYCIHAFVTIEEGHAIEFSPTKYQFIKDDVASYDLVNISVV